MPKGSDIEVISDVDASVDGDVDAYLPLMPRSSTSKIRVAPPGMLGGWPWSPEAMSEGQTSRAFSPTFIFCTPSVQHLITWLSANSAGCPRLYEESKTVPLVRRPS